MSVAFSDIFAEFLARARETRGLTQAELAKEARLSQSLISGLEKKNKIPTGDNIDKILKGLRMEAPNMCEMLALIGYELARNGSKPVDHVPGGLAQRELVDRLAETGDDLTPKKKRRQ